MRGIGIWYIILEHLYCDIVYKGGSHIYSHMSLKWWRWFYPQREREVLNQVWCSYFSTTFITYFTDDKGWRWGMVTRECFESWKEAQFPKLGRVWMWFGLEALLYGTFCGFCMLYALRFSFWTLLCSLIILFYDFAAWMCWEVRSGNKCPPQLILIKINVKPLSNLFFFLVCITSLEIGCIFSASGCF